MEWKGDVEKKLHLGIKILLTELNFAVLNMRILLDEKVFIHIRNFDTDRFGWNELNDISYKRFN